MSKTQTYIYTQDRGIWGSNDTPEQVVAHLEKLSHSSWYRPTGAFNFIRVGSIVSVGPADRRAS